MELRTTIFGVETSYKVVGDGEPILILHGWGGSSDSWSKVQQILADRGYKVIIPDLPGFGKSKTPKVPWSREDYLKWILEFTGSQGLREFFLIGHSFGGSLSMLLASKYPEKIKKMIICAASGIKRKLGLKDKAIYATAKIGNLFFSIKYLSLFKDGARNFFYLFLRNRDYTRADETMKKTLENVLSEDLSEEIPKIKTGTLLIWGTRDRLVPIKFGREINKKISGSKLEILNGVGHSPHLEIPDMLSDIILSFIRKQE